MTDPFTDAAAGTPYHLRPSDPILERHHLALLNQAERLER